MLNWSMHRQEDGAGMNHAARNPPLIDPSEPVDRRQGRIALALGGGAARGWAHIGVLRAFDEMNIPIGTIAGTSIGALVGGCYLAGKLDELEEFARSLTMRGMLGLLDFAIGGAGLFGGMRLTNRMREHLKDLHIEDLDRTFVAVATDAGTGHEVWIEKGNLITAIRASYALPGIFEPVKSGNRTLIDGALVNPVPVSVCRALEEHVVVAVNLHHDLYGRSAVIKHVASDAESSKNPISGAAMRAAGKPASRLGVTGMMVQAFNIIQDRISRARMAGDPPDLSLLPRLSDIGLSEFHRASEAIDRGYEEAMSRIEEVKRLQAVLAR